jgi:hypothetical protein
VCPAKIGIALMRCTMAVAVKARMSEADSVLSNFITLCSREGRKGEGGKEVALHTVS